LRVPAEVELVEVEQVSKKGDDHDAQHPNCGIVRQCLYDLSAGSWEALVVQGRLDGNVAHCLLQFAFVPWHRATAAHVRGFGWAENSLRRLQSEFGMPRAFLPP
jgi:hypothetical protein